MLSLTWRKATRLVVSLTIAVVGLGLVWGLLGTISGPTPRLMRPSVAQASSNIYCVTPMGGSYSGCNQVFTNVQAAVDAATSGEEVRIATGIYTDVHVRAGITQVVYISKTITLRGGYSTDFTGPSDPEANPTILHAQNRGRVFYITGDISPTVEGLCLVNGTAIGLGGGLSGEDAGGGVYVITATLTLSGNQIFSHTAFVGGGLYFQNSYGTLLSDNLITNNTAITNGVGGGLCLNKSANVTLTNNTISDNEAGPFKDGKGNGGGLIFQDSPGATLNNNIIHNNRATWVGGLRFDNSPGATLISNTVSNNVADHQGGGMKHHGGVLLYYSDDATLIENTIRGNYAANYCGGLCLYSSDNAVLNSNIIISNTARQPGYVGKGGGLCIESSINTTLFSNTISANKGKGDITVGTIYGGGMYLGPNCTAVLDHNTISANEATLGGGIFFERSSQISLTNNTFVGNSAVQEGGGLYLVDSPIQLDNNILARNNAPIGSGIQMTGSAILTGWHNTLVGSSEEGLRLSAPNNRGALTNTIFASFTIAVNVQAGTATLERTLWFGNVTNTIGLMPDDGHNPVYGDPAFHNPTADDYHITSTSAARDQGAPGGPAEDIDGEPRPCGPMADIGADEMTCTNLPVFLPVFLPVLLKNRP